MSTEPVPGQGVRPGENTLGENWSFRMGVGVLLAALGVRLRGDRYRVWPIASGVVSLVLAWFIWPGFPSSATRAVGLLVGVGLLTSGVQMVAVATGGRRAVEESTVAPAAGTGGA